jgi:serine/threonine protein kinase
MNWLDKFKGKGGRPDGQGEDKARQEPNREAGGTVVRAGARAGATLAKPGIRFQPNHEVTADLQIKRLLGSGGMGEVYLARQRLWDVDIALKVPSDEIVSDPENRHRIVREAEAWTDLGLHPNIAYCYYAQPLGELLLLVIEYVDGGNLRQWIADGRCADLKTGLDLAIQFCHGLEHAHKKGLVHRDIKPENILLMEDGTLKITDFGIVRKALAGPEMLETTGEVRRVAARMTTAGIGTADYMAPEQWGDQSGIDSRADIFAFGTCLYEMLCGGRPHPMTAGPRQEAPEPGRMRGGKGLLERLSRLMRRCVDWDRERRPAGAREVLAELCAVYEEDFGEPCPYAQLPELTSQADDWNNRALSYLALGRAEDAEKAWRTALEADPRHPESTYNYGLRRWRGAKATDQEILMNMRGVVEGDPSGWLPKYLMAQLHLERGDAEGAREELAKIHEDGVASTQVAAARRATEELPSPSGLVRAFEGGVYVVCLSADGRLALSGNSDQTLKLWEVDSGRCLRTFEGHTNVSSVCLSTDGRRALSGGRDKTLKLWEVNSGRCLRTFEGHTDQVLSVCLSVDGRFALSGGFLDKTLKLWDVESGSCLRTFEGHTSSVNSVFHLSGVVNEIHLRVRSFQHQVIAPGLLVLAVNQHPALDRCHFPKVEHFDGQALV